MKRCKAHSPSSQLSHLSDSLDQIIRIDPFSLLPREVNLRILGYLDAISLGRAAQVNKSWKALADDDLLWRRMCGQHIDRKCEKCGWGLPLLERRRLKVELKDRSPAAAVSIGSHNHDHHHGHHAHGHEVTKVVTRVEALGGKAPKLSEMLAARRLCDTPISLAWNSGTKRSAPSSPASSSTSLTKRIKVESDSEDEAFAKDQSVDSNQVRLTRPWKTVYCERLVVERNWRKGRCSTKTLKVGNPPSQIQRELIDRDIKTASCVCNTTPLSPTRHTPSSSPVHTIAQSGYGTWIPAQRSDNC